MSQQDAIKAIKRARGWLDKAEAAIDALTATQSTSGVPVKNIALKTPKPGPVWASVDNLNMTAWLAWLAERKTRGTPPLRSLGVPTWLATFSADDQTLIVQQSIDKGWAGLFEPKKKSGFGSQPEPDRHML